MGPYKSFVMVFIFDLHYALLFTGSMIFFVVVVSFPILCLLYIIPYLSDIIFSEILILEDQENIYLKFCYVCSNFCYFPIIIYY
jgi:hypothetical protein